MAARGQVIVGVFGKGEMEALLTRHLEEARVALDAALYAEGTKILAASVRQAPLDDGTLRRSATIQGPEREGTKTTITIGYGGPSADYAVVQHERTDFAHSEPGTKAKFLEDPANEAAIGLEGRLAAAVRTRLGQ